MKTNIQTHKGLIFFALLVTLGLSTNWASTAAADDAIKHDRKKGVETKGGLKKETPPPGSPKTPQPPKTDDKKTDAGDSSAKADAPKVAAEPPHPVDREVNVGDSIPLDTPIDRIYSFNDGSQKHVTFKITGINEQKKSSLVFKDGKTQKQEVTQTEAQVTCLTCGGTSFPVAINQSKNVNEIVKEIQDKIAEDMQVQAVAEKAAKKRQKAIDNCEVNEDGDKLKEVDKYACYGEKIMNGDPDDRLSSLRDLAESDLLDCIKDGENASKCRADLRALRTAVAGDKSLRKYMSRFEAFARDYQSIGNIARDSALNPTHRAANFLQIAQIDQKYATMPIKHSEETQSYIDTFNSAILTFAGEAQSSPYTAYNDYWNHNGNYNSAVPNNNQWSAGNNSAVGANPPSTFYVTNNGPRTGQNSYYQNNPFTYPQQPTYLQQGPGYQYNSQMVPSLQRRI